MSTQQCSMDWSETVSMKTECSRSAMKTCHSSLTPVNQCLLIIYQLEYKGFIKQALKMIISYTWASMRFINSRSLFCKRAGLEMVKAGARCRGANSGYFLNQDVWQQQIEQFMRPLWQLAKSTLTQTENLVEFHAFLINNARKHHHGSSINFSVMFSRVAVLMMFYQAECLMDHWWVLAYFCAKAALLFNVGFEIRQGIQILGMLACFHLLDYITNLLPFMNTFYWLVNIAYFLFGIEEKYLSFNLMILPVPVLNKSIVVTLLGLGRARKAPHYTRSIAYMDIVVLFLTKKAYYGFCFLLLVGLVETVREMDHRMLYTKKKYTHLDEIPNIEQYH